MLTIAEVTKYLGRTHPTGQGVLSRGRLRRSGVNILDENGNPWIGRGYNYGHGELWSPLDPGADVTAGANCFRGVGRAWGDYTAPTMDGAQLGAFGDYAVSYLAYLKAQFIAARRAGLRTILALDSNCGQGNGDPTYCTLSATPNQNFWTVLGAAQQLPAHINRGRIMLRVLHGLVDIVEPLVEPNPASNLQTDINAVYLQCMRAWLPEDPSIIFMLGGQSYQHGKIDNVMSVGTSWPTDQIMLTCDYLDNIMTSGSAQFTAAVGDATSARKTTGYPFFGQQCGTVYTSDADGSLFASNIDQLRTASGGSIGWTFWEKVSKNVNSYGPWFDNSDGLGRLVASGGAARRAVVEAAFQASKVSPT